MVALDSRDVLVGVSNYSIYQDIDKVGDMFKPNYEYIYSKKPTHVLLLAGQPELEKKFLEMNLTTVSVSNESIKDILNSIKLLGHLLEKQINASGLVKKIEMKILKIQNKKRKLKSALIVVDRASESLPSDVYLAGEKSLFTEIFLLFNVHNLHSCNCNYQKLSFENLLDYHPDLIIDMSQIERSDLDGRDLSREWNNFFDSKLFSPKEQNYIRPGANLYEIFDSLENFLD